jgi:DNA-binding CsgD family transcriptional regulator
MNPVHTNNLSGDLLVTGMPELYDEFVLYRTRHMGPETQFTSPGNTESTIRLVRLLDPQALMSVDPQGLSERNIQALVWGALGKSAEQQAQALHLAKNTIHTHRVNLYKTIGATSLAHAVHIAFRDEIFYPGGGAPALDLSQRERAVLIVMSEGHEAEDAAKRLFLSTDTVRSHMNNILRKNVLWNAPSAITLGYLSGNIPLPKR